MRLVLKENGSISHSSNLNTELVENEQGHTVSNQPQACPTPDSMPYASTGRMPTAPAPYRPLDINQWYPGAHLGHYNAAAPDLVGLGNA